MAEKQTPAPSEEQNAAGNAPSASATPQTGTSSNKAAKIGAAVGIGSAAIVAALLYSRRKS